MNLERKAQGRVVLLLVGLGMLFGLIGPEVQEFESWAEATQPDFVGFVLMQFGVLAGSWLAGQMTPGGKVAKAVSSTLSDGK